MSSYDQNSYSDYAYSRSAWDLARRAFQNTKRFTLNAITRFKVALNAR